MSYRHNVLVLLYGPWPSFSLSDGFLNMIIAWLINSTLRQYFSLYQAAHNMSFMENES